MNVEERRTRNSSQNKIGDKSFYPSKMADGEALFAHPKNKSVRLYKKIKGIKWWVNFTKDGNLWVDKVLTVGIKIISRLIDVKSLYINGAESIDSNNYATGLKSRQVICFGYDAAISAIGTTTTVDATTVDSSTNGQGYRMIRAGKVTGVSLQADCTEDTGTGTIKSYVQKNASNQSMFASASDSAGDVGAISTSNSFTFSENDTINVEIQVEETGGLFDIEFNNIAILVEFES